MLAWLRRIADIKGRGSRAEFWLYNLLKPVVGVFLTVVMSVSPAGQVPLLLAAGKAALWLVLAAGDFTVSARRMHDIDRSGWWSLLVVPAYVGTVPGLLGFVPGGLGAPDGWDMLATQIADPGLQAMMGPMWIVEGACGLAYLIMVSLKGTAGPNRFGLQPRGGKAAQGPAEATDAPIADLDAIDIDIAAAQPAAPAHVYAAPPVHIPAPTMRPPVRQAPARPVFGRRGV